MPTDKNKIDSNVDIYMMRTRIDTLFLKLITKFTRQSNMNRLCFSIRLGYILNMEFQCGYERNPIESINSRIKSQESIILKMKKKGFPLTVNYMISGIRVVCRKKMSELEKMDNLRARFEITYQQAKEALAAVNGDLA